jgi:CBS domain-containing protein
MRVRDVMTPSPASCPPDATLAEVASAMQENCCGALPVVGRDGRVVGIVTDRDICMVTALANVMASSVTAEEAMARKVETCRPEDGLLSALRHMEGAGVRRLPVVDASVHLVGMVSVDDIVQHAHRAGGKRKTVSEHEAMRTVKALAGLIAARRQARRGSSVGREAGSRRRAHSG